MTSALPDHAACCSTACCKLTPCVAMRYSTLERIITRFEGSTRGGTLAEAVYEHTSSKIPHSHTPNAPGDNRTRGTCVDERELSVVWPRVHGLLRHLRMVQHGALGYSVHVATSSPRADVVRLPTCLALRPLHKAAPHWAQRTSFHLPTSDERVRVCGGSMTMLKTWLHSPHLA